VTLWLPENEHVDEFIFSQMMKSDPRVDEYVRLLKQVDERLDLVYAKPDAHFVSKGDRWYIIRRGDTGIGGMWVCEDEAGEYTFPHEGHLNALRSLDVQKHGDVTARLADERRKKQEAADLHKLATKELFRSELNDRIAHTHDARIAVPKALPDDQG